LVVCLPSAVLEIEASTVNRHAGAGGSPHRIETSAVGGWLVQHLSNCSEFRRAKGFPALVQVGGWRSRLWQKVREPRGKRASGRESPVGLQKLEMPVW
jgi:hypothetical protein